MVTYDFLFSFPVPLVDFYVRDLQLVGHLPDLSLGPVCTLLELALEERVVLFAHSGLVAPSDVSLASHGDLLRKYVTHVVDPGAATVLHGQRRCRRGHFIVRGGRVSRAAGRLTVAIRSFNRRRNNDFIRRVCQIVITHTILDV